MDIVINILFIIGTIDTIILSLIVVTAIFTWSKGILPALWRLGNGLAKRKIAVFAQGDHLVELKNLLTDSKIFNKKNIIEVSSMQDFGRADQATLFLVFWHDWASDLDKILDKKSDQTALVVYAPRDLGDVPGGEMKKINEHRNSMLTNFRGRLLNDLVSSMITTSYEKE